MKGTNGVKVSASELTENESEVNALKEKIKDLKTNLEMAKVEFEQMELNKERMLEKINSNDDQIETFLKN